MTDLQKQISNLPPEKRELFEIMLREQGVDLSQLMILPQPRSQEKNFPLSFSQQRLWFLDQLEPGSHLYNINSVIRMRGTLDISALKACFNTLIQRHEILRTYFVEEHGQASQAILDELTIDIPVHVLEESSSETLEESIHKLAMQESRKPFDLKKCPLLRAKLIKCSEDHHVLVLIMHHIVSDNWSTGLIVAEILELYRAYSDKREPDLPELKIQYADFAVWQRKWLQNKTLEKQLNYWREKLDNAPPLLNLPLDRNRPSYQTYNGDYLLFKLQSDKKTALKKVLRDEDVTLFMLLLAVFETLLYRYSGQKDILVGTPIANRNRSETEHVLGFFVNTLVMRGDFTDNPTFKELLRRIKEDNLDAQNHQDIPFETVVEKLQPERDMSHSPFFQTMFVLNNAPVEKLHLPGLELELIEIENKTAKFDIVLNALETEDGITFKLEYNTDLYNRDTMERFSTHYLNLLSSAIENPALTVDQLQIMNHAERSTILEDFSKSEDIVREYTSVIDLFREQAQKTPDAACLMIGADQWSYGELDRQSDQLCSYLIKKGLSKNDIVGLHADRCFELIAGLLAVLKAGGTYLPLDPNYPVDRLAYMIEDAGVRLILSKESLVNTLPEYNGECIILDSPEAQWSREDPGKSIQLESDDAAYVIYTSGSTGKPKGVLVDHGPFAGHCAAIRDHFEIEPNDKVLQFAALNFDASLEQLFTPLITGATVVMRDNEIWSTSEFHKKIDQYGLTVINPPTAYWVQLTDEWARHPERIPSDQLRLVIVGGDILEKAALKKWQQTSLKDVRLLNAYGPTEAIITATTFDISPGFSAEKSKTRVPIGRPRGDRKTLVLDKNGNLCPVGIPGELYIGGSFLAREYLKRDELSEERFIRNPFDKSGNGRLYRTGDLVRFLADGHLEFLGRVDDQVKIRGFRIEPGEIETALSEHTDLDKVVVVARPDLNNQKQLIAYFTCGRHVKPAANALRDFLKSKLPEYMLPAYYVHLEKMPLDPSGKIDRKSLPDPEGISLKVDTEFVAPRTETEKRLAGMVKDLLDVERVGVHDNFFELGGHSMMATQVVSRIRESFNVEISLRSLFENPTVEGIAAGILEAQVAIQEDDELSGMLDEIENISDEDLEALLDEDDS